MATFEEQLAVLNAWAEAWSQADAVAAAELSTPETQFKSKLVGVGGGLYQGHTGLSEYFTDIADTLTDRHMTIELAEDYGDALLTRAEMVAVGAASGTPLSWTVWPVTRFEDDRIASATVYSSREEALGAEGLTGREPLHSITVTAGQP